MQCSEAETRREEEIRLRSAAGKKQEVHELEVASSVGLVLNEGARVD